MSRKVEKKNTEHRHKETIKNDSVFTILIAVVVPHRYTYIKVIHFKFMYSLLYVKSTKLGKSENTLSP